MRPGRAVPVGLTWVIPVPVSSQLNVCRPTSKLAGSVVVVVPAAVDVGLVLLVVGLVPLCLGPAELTALQAATIPATTMMVARMDDGGGGGEPSGPERQLCGGWRGERRCPGGRQPYRQWSSGRDGAAESAPGSR